jgi:hypothetical protein
MEDIRKLLNDEQAEIAPEVLSYTLRGLTWALARELRDGVPSDPVDRNRHLEIRSALTRSMKLYSAAMARWMERHVDECPLKT